MFPFWQPASHCFASSFNSFGNLRFSAFMFPILINVSRSSPIVLNIPFFCLNFHFILCNYTFFPPRIGIMVRVVFHCCPFCYIFKCSGILDFFCVCALCINTCFSCFKHNVTHFHPLKHHLHLKVGHSLFLFRKHNYQYEFFKLYLRITIRDRYALADEG
uniref:Uncharacterized protein n=1 Tax=Cacopsylla melanoneura TaxID=428564 RepID=A0A8D8ZIP3_9HEMI